MIIRPMPKAKYLRAVFTYCPESGCLYWNWREDVPNKVNGRFAGKEAGSLDRGYLTVRLNGVLYFVHRIIYVILHGDCLTIEDEIDHKDLCGVNNRPNNLRKSTRSNNCANRELQSNNTSGSKSIDILPNRKYRARICSTHIGVFDTLEEATKAYGEAAKKRFGEFGRQSSLP